MLGEVHAAGDLQSSPIELNLLTLDLPTLGIISGALVVIDAGLFVVSRATFQREEILTRWK